MKNSDELLTVVVVIGKLDALTYSPDIWYTGFILVAIVKHTMQGHTELG